MKYLIASILLLLTFSVQAQFTGATLRASGLTCAMCSKAVFNALSTVPYVEKVQPDIQASTYQISFRAGSAVDPDLLAKAVTNAGFSVAKLEMTGEFPETAIGKDSHMTLNNQVFHFVQTSSKQMKGKQTIRFVDKMFLSAKEHKNYARLTTMSCFATGTRQSCCPPANGSTSNRVYHVIL